MLGHCICDPAKPCPCGEFKEFDVCACAGEKMPPPSEGGKIRLTRHVKSAGCASKISKKDLDTILAGLPQFSDKKVIVGSSAGDDAGVVRLPGKSGNAMVLTVDVFAPSVDDPYTFGQISAANSVSDIYAMGAEPWCALSIIGFPVSKFPNKVMSEILRGGIDKMREAGISVVGGHSINDDSIKCGFAVIGICPENKFTRNQGAKPGDLIILTKPLGVGITAFAGQIGNASPRQLNEIANSMKTLNKIASETMRKYDVHAVTDVTGFSLTGHLSEIVKKSSVEVELDFDSIPLFSGTTLFSRKGICPGAVERNRESVNPSMLDFSELAEAQENILFCPETSGGLLVFLPKKQASAYVGELSRKGISAASVIGKVIGKLKGGRIRVKTLNKENYNTLKFNRKENEVKRKQDLESPACCSSPSAPELSEKINAPSQSASGAFADYMAAVSSPGAINGKNKKLISLALSVATKCGPCIKINVQGARGAGASDDEISEAVSLGIAFGGASASMFYKTTTEEGKK